MADPVTYVLGGIALTAVSVSAGKIWGGKNKVSDPHCEERRKACSSLIVQKIDSLSDKIEDMGKKIDRLNGNRP